MRFVSELCGRGRQCVSHLESCCGSGYRATAAASLLESAGRVVVLIDDMFGAAEAGVPVTDGT